MFETQEVSRARGEPVDLYLFVYGPGAGEYYAYTDSEKPITFGGKTYNPLPIMRSEIKSSGTLDRATLNVTSFVDCEAAELFRVYPPTQPVVLIIRQGHANDPDSEFLVAWSGRVLGCSRNGGEAEFQCEPVSTSMKRSGLRRHYQIGCGHALYQGDASGGCRADKEAATENATVDEIDNAVLTLAAGWNGTRAKEKFLGGLVEWNNSSGARERRTILRVNPATNTLTLTGVIRDLEVGDPVDVILGCNHQLDDCEHLHNNVPDYGGQWLIPTKNPIGAYNNYY